MELELSLGDSLAPVKHTITLAPAPARTCNGEGHDLALGLGVTPTEVSEKDSQRTSPRGEDIVVLEDDKGCPQVELPVGASLSCPMNVVSIQTRSANSEVCKQGFDVNAVPVDDGASTVRSLSPSSMQLAEVPWLHAVEQEASEDEENGGGRVRKKLRLSKEQSAFLEDSFKEHSTLTLEQKSNIANRLSLRPRQVEVWFQNRRARRNLTSYHRTKLKQTETDCEYLKRSCQTLTLENRRLQREVAELRAFRPTYPLYNHHLYGVRACPSCDNKATTYTNPLLVTTAAAVSSPGQGTSPASAMPTLFSSRPRFGPFTTTGHTVLRRQPSATS
uniref:Uncharacterized protein n=2 Tax=Avena sativa TaxID=4498 RepID=A0ACD5ZFY0_AVESA